MECYDARHKKWKGSIDNFAKKKEDILTELLQNDCLRPMDLRTRYGMAYNTALRRLQQAGYPIIRERKGSEGVKIFIEKEYCRCIMCDGEFVHLPLLSTFPDFFCPSCKPLLLTDKALMESTVIGGLSRMLPQTAPISAVVSDEVADILIHPEFVFIEPDNGETEASDDTNHQIAGDDYLRTIYSSSIIHLAGKACLQKTCSSVEIAGLFGLGVALMRGHQLTKSQLNLLKAIGNRVMATNLLGAPCEIEDCEWCGQAKSRLIKKIGKMNSLDDFIQD